MIILHALACIYVPLDLFCIYFCTWGISDLIQIIFLGGYSDIKKVEIYECTAKEFQQGFDFIGSEIRIDLTSNLEEIEAKND